MNVLAVVTAAPCAIAFGNEKMMVSEFFPGDFVVSPERFRVRLLEILDIFSADVFYVNGQRCGAKAKAVRQMLEKIAAENGIPVRPVSPGEYRRTFYPGKPGDLGGMFKEAQRLNLGPRSIIEADVMALLTHAVSGFAAAREEREHA